jgi:hypothetical protein
MLRNRKQETANKLKGVNRADEETDLELGFFTRLQNWVPADLYSIKKKRGISPLDPNLLSSITTEDDIELTTEDGVVLTTET